MKEWHAIATYLQDMGEFMSGQYAGPDGRKLVYSSLNPASLLRNANHFTWIALAVILVLILLTVVVIRAVRRKKQKQK